MALSRSSWRSLAVLAALCVLPLGLGCGGKKKTSTAGSGAASVTISGTVTYTRRPLLADPATGIPLGLETDTAKFQSLPLRGVAVRAFQATQETDASGNAVSVWKLVGAVSTGTDGTYSMSVTSGVSTFVEVISSMSSTSGSVVRVLATSISDTRYLADRPFYILRKGADGSSPAGDLTPGSTPTANATVDFAIDPAKAWWVGPTASVIEKTVTTGATPTTTWAPSVTLETSPTGSRVAAILDSAYTFGSLIGDPSPGGGLSLHYDPNSSDAGPSFVEYDRTVYPHSWNGSALTYFGYLRATAANDDAWDEGVIFPLLARNYMFSQGFTTLVPTTPLADRSDLQDLRPDMALMEGFSQAIAATLLKSPYLADTSAGGTTYRDIRVTSGLGNDAYSPANMAAIAWKLNLNASGTLNGTVITPVADTPAGWATLTQVAIRRFFGIVVPKDASTSTYPTDIGSIYSQVARLKESKAATDTVDLAAYFPDATLTTLLAPFNITWPRPVSTNVLPDPLQPEAGFMADWGANPNSATKALPAFTLSMGKARVNNLAKYPNFSKGEVFKARFTLSGDRVYKLGVSTPSGIPSTAKLEIIVGGTKYLIDAGTQLPLKLQALIGNSTTPTFQTLQVRLLSPDTPQPDLPITLRLDL